MSEIKLHLGDCLEIMPTLADNSVDVVITSPPYADMKDYCKIDPEIYPDWLLPIMQECSRVIKETGNIIVVIDDCFSDGFLNPYVFRTLINILDNTDLKLAQRHYWLKPNPHPDNTQRLTNAVENIFQFCKNGYYANKDAVRVAPSIYAKKDKRRWKYNPKGSDPSNIIYLKKSQTQAKIHPALYPEKI